MGFARGAKTAVLTKSSVRHEATGLSSRSPSANRRSGKSWNGFGLGRLGASQRLSAPESVCNESNDAGEPGQWPGDIASQGGGLLRISALLLPPYLFREPADPLAISATSGPAASS